MGVKKRGLKWWVDFRFNHQRHRYPSPENSRAGSLAYESLLRQRLTRGEPILGVQANTPKQYLYRDYVEEWFISYVIANNKRSEASNKRSVLNAHLIPFFGKFKLDEITSYEIEKYKASKLSNGTSCKTVNNILGVLSKSLKIAQEWDLIKSTPRMKKLKVPPQKYDFLSDEESQLLLNCTDGLLHDMILFALHTGLRFGEIIAVTWDSINFNENVLIVDKAISRGFLGTTKSNKIRHIPMSVEVLAMLERRRSNNDLVFHHPEGKYLPQENCRRLLHNALDKIGLRRIGWHVFRHTFASRLAENGISMRTIQELLGHSDTNTTMRYAHLSPVVLRDAIRTLERPIKIHFGHNLVTIEKKPITNKYPARYV